MGQGQRVRLMAHALITDSAVWTSRGTRTSLLRHGATGRRPERPPITDSVPTRCRYHIYAFHLVGT